MPPAYTGISSKEGGWDGKEDRELGSCVDGLWGWGLVVTAGSWLLQLNPRSPGDREGCAGIWFLPSEFAAWNAVSAQARG